MKPKIAILTTGGTIAGATSKTTKDEIMSGNDLLGKYAQDLEAIVDFEVIELDSKDSMNITMADWKRYAGVAYETMLREDITGILMLTGTNTMQYISMAMALMIQNLDKPFVITGALDPNPASAPVMLEPNLHPRYTEHVRKNLVDSANIAAYSGINEVTVCFAGDSKLTHTNIYRGSTVVELDASAEFAGFGYHFEDAEPLGKVEDGKIIMNSNYIPIDKNGKLTLTATADTNVEQAVYLPGSILFDYTKTNATGLVIDCNGMNAAANDDLYQYIKNSLQAGLPIVVSNADTRFMSPPVTTRYDELVGLGMIDMGMIHPYKAFVKLAWATPQTNGNMVQLRQIMTKDYVRELEHTGILRTK